MTDKIDARKLLGLQPVRQEQYGPLQMHDAGVAATLMDGTVYKAAIDLWIAADNDAPFEDFAKIALNSLDTFREVVRDWSAAKRDADLQTSETAAV